MVEDITDTKAGKRRVEIHTGIGRRRRWADEEKGRIVAEAVAPGAVVADVARRHDMTPQHLFTWIRAAKAGDFSLPADGTLVFVPVVSTASVRTSSAAPRERVGSIEVTIGTIEVRVRNGADARTVEAVLRAVKRAHA